MVVSRARDLEGLFEGLNLWRTVRRTRRAARATDCASLDEAADRIETEVADTYPAFELRGLDWPAICARHRERLIGATDPLAAAQRWLAELEDSHTWVWPGHGNLPYVLEVGPRSIVFAHVPPATPAHAAGVRPGWRLTHVDGHDPDGADWLARTAAPAHSRPYLAGRRLLAGPAGVTRVLTATGPDGRRGDLGGRAVAAAARARRDLEPAPLGLRLSPHRRLAAGARRGDRSRCRRAARRGDPDPRPAAQSGRQSRPRSCHAGSVPAGHDHARLDPLQRRRRRALGAVPAPGRAAGALLRAGPGGSSRSSTS